MSGFCYFLQIRIMLFSTLLKTWIVDKKNIDKLYITLFEKLILIFSFFWFSRWLRPFTNQVNLIKLKTVKLLNKWLFYNKTNQNIFIYYIPTCLQGRLRWSFKGLGLGNTYQIRQPQLFPIQKWDKKFENIFSINWIFHSVPERLKLDE